MKTKILLGIAMAAAGLVSYAFVGNESKGYEYVTIDYNNGFIYISQAGTEVKTIDVRKERSNNSTYDQSPVLKRVMDYEAEGWEMVENEFKKVEGTPMTFNYFLLRKTKE